MVFHFIIRVSVGNNDKSSGIFVDNDTSNTKIAK